MISEALIREETVLFSQVNIPWPARRLVTNSIKQHYGIENLTRLVSLKDGERVNLMGQDLFTLLMAERTKDRLPDFGPQEYISCLREVAQDIGTDRMRDLFKPKQQKYALERFDIFKGFSYMRRVYQKFLDLALQTS